MEDKKLKKIGKKELLEILLSQAKKIDELEKELKRTQKLLDSKKIAIEECGSLADASLKLNNVFEVAQQAAEQYLLNVQERCKKIENDIKKACQVEKDKIIKNTEKICNKKIKETEKMLAEKTKSRKEKPKKSSAKSSRKKNSAKTVVENPKTKVNK